MAQQAQGGVKVTATDRQSSPSTNQQVTMPVVPLSHENLKFVEQPQSAVSTAGLLKNNIKLLQDGTITFSAQSLNPNSKINYSFSSNGKASSLDSAGVGAKISSMEKSDGFELEVTGSTTNSNARNIYLTVRKDVDKFRVDIDGKTYIIDRKQIEEAKDGKTVNSSTASISTNAVISNEVKSFSPTSPISAKYPDLENLRLTPKGEVQFSITTKANDMLLHYARYDGSSSLSGYDAVFREGNSGSLSNIRLVGAYHQDKTFTLGVNHQDANTVKVDFILDKNVKSASVRMGSKTYAINSDELRSHIIEKTVEAERQKGVAQFAAPKLPGRDPDPAKNPKLGDQPDAGKNPKKNDGTPVKHTQGELDKLHRDADKKNNPDGAKDQAFNAGLATGVAREAQRRASVANAKATEEKAKPKVAVADPKIVAEQETIRSARNTVEKLKNTPPANDDRPGQKETAKELRDNQKARFKALDSEAEKIGKRMRGAKPESSEFKTAEAELKANRTLRAELVAERIKVNQAFIKDNSNVVEVEPVKAELYSLKSEGLNAYRVLKENAPTDAAKLQVEAAEAGFTTEVQNIKPGMLQSLREGAGKRISGIKDAVAKSPTVEKTLNFLKKASAQVPFTTARKEEKSNRALDEVKEANKGTTTSTEVKTEPAKAEPTSEPRTAGKVAEDIKALEARKVALQEQQGKATEPAEIVKLEVEKLKLDVEENRLKGEQKQIEKSSTAQAEVEVAKQRVQTLREVNPRTTTQAKELLEAQLNLESTKLGSIQSENAGLKENIKHQTEFLQTLDQEHSDPNTKQELKPSIESSINEIKSNIENLENQVKAGEANKARQIKNLKLVEARVELFDLKNPETGVVDAKLVHNAEVKVKIAEKHVITEETRAKSIEIEARSPATTPIEQMDLQLLLDKEKCAIYDRYIADPDISEGMKKNIAEAKLIDANDTVKNIRSQIESASVADKSEMGKRYAESVKALRELHESELEKGGKNSDVRQAESNLKAAETDLSARNEPSNKLKVDEAKLELEKQNAKVSAERNAAVEKMINEVNLDSVKDIPEVKAEATKLNELKGKVSLENQYLEKRVQVAEAEVELHKTTHPADPAVAPDVVKVKLAEEKIAKLKGELQTIEEARGVNEPTTKTASTPPVDTTPTTPAPEPTPKPLDLARMQQLDTVLAGEEVRLASKVNPTVADSNKLAEIKAERAKLALNAKAALEDKMADGATESERIAAKNDLYEKWADRVENALPEAEKAKFRADRASHEIDKLAETTKFKGAEFKEANKALSEAQKEITKAGDKATEAQKSEVKVQEAKVEVCKISELASVEGISEAGRIELQVRRTDALKNMQSSLDVLEKSISEQLNETGIDPAKKALLEKRLIEVKAEQARTNGHIENQKLAKEGQSIVQEYKDAISAKDKAQADFERTGSPADELKLRQAEIDLHKKNIARANFEERALRGEIDQIEKGMKDLRKLVSEATGETQVTYEKALKIAEKDVEVRKKILEETIKGVQDSAALIQQQAELATAKADLLRMQNPETVKPVSTPEEIATKARAVAELEIRVNEAVTARNAQLKARIGAARLWARAKAFALRPTDLPGTRNPLASLAIVTSAHAALDGAMRADLDPNASHSFAPSLLACLSQDTKYWYLGNTFRTTEDITENYARLREATSHLLDAGIQFGAVVGAFELVTRGTPALYNMSGRISFIGSSRLYVGLGGMGSRVMAVANPALAVAASYQMGYSSTAGGQFLTGDKKIIGFIPMDVADIGAPTAGSVILGSAAGPFGIAALGIVQVAGTFSGIEHALNKLDKESENFLVKRTVMQSIQGATDDGLFVPKNALLSGGIAVPESRRKTYKPEEINAIDEIAMSDLYEHFINSALGTVPKETKEFYGKKLKLNEYSVYELEWMRLAADPDKVNLKASQVESANFALVKDLFSKEKKYSGGQHGYDVAAFFWNGDTALDNIKDKDLREKVRSDIKALREFYDHIYDHSLKTTIKTTNASTTHEQFRQEYWNQVGNTVTFGWIADSSGSNSDGRLNSTSDIKHYTGHYANYLSGANNFVTEVVDKISPDRSKNMLELIDSLPKYYPGINTILESKVGFVTFANSFHKPHLERGEAGYIDPTAPGYKPTDSYNKFGVGLIEFREYANSLTKDPEFMSFVKDINDPKKAVSTLDERFEKYFPGIGSVLNKGDHGIKMLENMIGDQHPFVMSVKKSFASTRAQYPTLDFQDVGGILTGKTNKEKLTQLLKLNAVQAVDGYTVVKNHTGENRFNIEKDPATGLKEPAGFGNYRGWTILRTIRKKNSDELLPVILNIPSDSFSKYKDPAIRYAENVLMLAKDRKTGEIKFNTNIDVGGNPTSSEFSLLSGEVKSDGSIYVTVKEPGDRFLKKYIIAPSMKDGALVWEKKEQWNQGGK